MRNLLLRYQVRQYVRKLFYYLVRDIGLRQHYKLKKIDQTISKYGFNKRYAYLAYAMFLEKKIYEKAKHRKGIEVTQNEARELIANIYFNSNANFTYQDLFSISAFKGWKDFITGDLSVIDYAAYNAWKNYSGSVELDGGYDIDP